MKVLMILPAYNEEETILSTVGQIQTAQLPQELEVDYVVINDGSSDATERICRENHIRSLASLTAPIAAGECDFTVGSRFLDGSSTFRSSACSQDTASPTSPRATGPRGGAPWNTWPAATPWTTRSRNPWSTCSSRAFGFRRCRSICSSAAPDAPPSAPCARSTI